MKLWVKKRFDVEASGLKAQLKESIGVELEVKIYNFYRVEGLGKEELARCVNGVFSEANLDEVFTSNPPLAKNEFEIGVALSLAQFDARADSAVKCVEMITQQTPKIRTAKIYRFVGDESLRERIKQVLINPVDSVEFDADLQEDFSAPCVSGKVEVLEGFCELSEGGLSQFLKSRALAMSLADLLLAQEYFRQKRRNPTITEIKVLDTYWSDHCRHTTFNTELVGLNFAPKSAVAAAFEEYLALREKLGVKKSVTLMDMAIIAPKWLKKQGILKNLDESEEINACSVRVGEQLLMFKNETHNHPTEIEPFGGAATCLGGAIRDPLSGRAYVFGGVRLSGAANPLNGAVGVKENDAVLKQAFASKLTQTQICLNAAAGFSSYGNQIGVATPLVKEIYHPGFAAKRFEMGGVLAVANADAVVRCELKEGDVVVLLGGRTGADGVGGATGSSKTHDESSTQNATAEVQKGNAPMERKIQRLFRKNAVTRLIKRCNDFGAGGVSVAVGELAGGVEINLDEIRTKRSGLDATALALSESQERMAAVVAGSDAAEFLRLCEEEDLEAKVVAKVTARQAVVMKHKGEVVVEIDREFLDKNGAKRAVKFDSNLVFATSSEAAKAVWNCDFAAQEGFEFDATEDFAQNYTRLMSSENVASVKGLVERFDFSVGASTIFAPFGGKFALSEQDCAVFRLPRFDEGGLSLQSSDFGEVLKAAGKELSNSNLTQKERETAVFAALGVDVNLTNKDEFEGGFYAVVSAVAKAVVAGARREFLWLSLQEYFASLGSGADAQSQRRWSRVGAALLGAQKAQLDIGVGAIGGKDSMSGTFKTHFGEFDVPPTIAAFAVGVGAAGEAVSVEFKRAGSAVWLVEARLKEGKSGELNSLSERDFDALLAVFERLNQSGVVLSASVSDNLAQSVAKMAFGNGVGFEFDGAFSSEEIFAQKKVAIVVEISADAGVSELKELLENRLVKARVLGHTTAAQSVKLGSQSASLKSLAYAWQSLFEPLYKTSVKPLCEDEIFASPQKSLSPNLQKPNLNFATPSPAVRVAKPRVLIPAFFGTNCEFDTQKVFKEFGGEAEIFLVKNMTIDALKRSVEEFAAKLKEAQILFIPGGFSGADEPDGSAKFITAFFRTQALCEASKTLLANGGLIGGICNGFQALIKLGLLPYGEVRPQSSTVPTLTFNDIARHQSRLVTLEILPNRSVWLKGASGLRRASISHGEGRFVCQQNEFEKLLNNGQICSLYTGVNPNGSLHAVEGICSEDGRVFGRMSHIERGGFKNSGFAEDFEDYDLTMFKNAVEFFK